MPLFRIAKITERPTNTITRWSVREVQLSCETEKTHHLVGYILEEYASRVSSKIVAFDEEKMLVLTENGRIYNLQGKPGTSRDGDYVWDMWSLSKGAKNEIDMTNQFYGKDDQ